jgi:hypothetical protein
MLDNTITAARAAGARIVLPGTVYNFGPDAFPDLPRDIAAESCHRQGPDSRQFSRELDRSPVHAKGGTVSLIGPHRKRQPPVVAAAYWRYCGRHQHFYEIQSYRLPLGAKLIGDAVINPYPGGEHPGRRRHHAPAFGFLGWWIDADLDLTGGPQGPGMSLWFRPRGARKGWPRGVFSASPIGSPAQYVPNLLHPAVL